jgi:hypothetical protein
MISCWCSIARLKVFSCTRDMTLNASRSVYTLVERTDTLVSFGLALSNECMSFPLCFTTNTGFPML